MKRLANVNCIVWVSVNASDDIADCLQMERNASAIGRSFHARQSFMMMQLHKQQNRYPILDRPNKGNFLVSKISFDSNVCFFELICFVCFNLRIFGNVCDKSEPKRIMQKRNSIQLIAIHAVDNSVQSAVSQKQKS